jgi:TPR repeat protein
MNISKFLQVFAFVVPIHREEVGMGWRKDSLHPAPSRWKSNPRAGTVGVVFRVVILGLIVSAQSPQQALGQEAVTPAPKASASTIAMIVNDATPISEMRAQAELGNAVAQRMLSTRLAKGKGVKKDMVESVTWLRKAADQGDAKAQDALGSACLLGTGMAQDTQEAVKWYRLAAEQSNVDAIYSLGRCYAHGTGMPKDVTEAMKWYT